MAGSHSRILAALLLFFAVALLLYLAFFREGYKPVHRLGPGDLPEIVDDLDTDSLIGCVRRQIAYLKKQEPAKTITFGEDNYDIRWLLLSQEQFLAKLLTRPDFSELKRYLREHYIFYQAGGRKDKRGRKMLVTGYYEPVFAGSLTGEPPFLTPLYAPPKSLVTVKGQAGEEPRIGRYDAGNTLINF
jgi:membrane-bound lytic murein transglycosylase A